MAITLLQLRTKVREQADIEAATDRHPDADIDGYINDAINELYLHANRYGVLRVEKNYEFTATGAASYALPTDYFGTVGVWLKKNDYSVLLKRHDIMARPFEGPTNSTSGDWAGTYRETFFDDGSPAWQIELYPSPSTGDFLVSYVPIPTALSADGDEINVFTGIMGWDKFIVYEACIQVKLRDDLPYQQFDYERKRILDRIAEEAELRNLSDSRIIVDRRRARSYIDSGDIRHGRSGDFWWIDYY